MLLASLLAISWIKVRPRPAQPWLGASILASPVEIAPWRDSATPRLLPADDTSADSARRKYFPYLIGCGARSYADRRPLIGFDSSSLSGFADSNVLATFGASRPFRVRSRIVRHFYVLRALEPCQLASTLAFRMGSVQTSKGVSARWLHHRKVPSSALLS